MTTRLWAVAALALMVPSTLGVVTVAAQSGRTAPPAVDLTCHGYDEGTTRAYNCIPEPSQQHHMRTFVPPVGSACDAGSIGEFPPGRIVFQIRCRDGSQGQTAAWSYRGRGAASFAMSVDAPRVWVHTAFSGSSVHFVVRCRAPQQSVVVNELLGRSWGNSGTNGVYGMAGCRELEVDTGGQDLQWSFTQELAATALMPPQSWEQVTGAGSALPAQALQDLAGAVELERLWGRPSHWRMQHQLARLVGAANAHRRLMTDAEGGSSLDLRIASRLDDLTYALDGASVRSATTRTVPLTLDLTCHGYVEAAGTRAYNCIPEPSQQHHMRTFVPPVGSACDAGSIGEFPPGRIVFQIRCLSGVSSHSPGSVRVLYVAPANREFRADYSNGISRAIVDVQSWYREQLEDLTFAIYSVMPEWCQLPRDEDYYSRGNAWEKVLTDVQSCAPVRSDTSEFVWALYVDVDEDCGEPHELGAGWAGVTMVPRWDLEGVASPGEYYYCDDGPYEGTLGRWYGGLAHELAHAFYVPHPPGCEENLPTCDSRALMWLGYEDYPNTYLRDDEKQILRRSPFFGRN